MTPEEILKGPDYFTCDRTHCRLKKVDCMGMQAKNERSYFTVGRYKRIECLDCEQGKKIKEEVDMAKEKCLIEDCIRPSIIRKLCQNCYNRWRKGKIDHPELGRWEPINPEKEAPGAEVEEKPVKTIEHPIDVDSKAWVNAETAISKGSVILNIPINDYPEIMEALEISAKKHFRTPEQQALYYIHKQLQGAGLIKETHNISE